MTDKRSLFKPAQRALLLISLLVAVAHTHAQTQANMTTSYKGQLLEITFTLNLNTSPELKKEIDHIMDSAHLEE